MSDLTCDILILGGGTGGCAAALAACTLGMNVILTEETQWIGGQLTSQAVPPDEHPWIESFGCTRTYREYRLRVRQWYRDHGQLTAAALAMDHLNPGNGWVSWLCHEPRVGVEVLNAMLAPHLASGQLRVLLGFTPDAATTDGDVATSVRLKPTKLGEHTTIGAKFILDATELGDGMALTGTEFRTGSESQSEFGELHAPSVADPDDIQAFTWCFAMGYAPGTNNIKDPPRDYAKWRAFVPDLVPAWPARLLGWTVSDVRTLQQRTYSLFGQPSMFTYRRIVVGGLHTPTRDDVTIVNWPQNDCLERVIGGSACDAQLALENSRQLSLSLFYWLQTEAERHDGGSGYPELYLSGDSVGTEDGLAMAPYHRESRRLVSEFTLSENHVGVEARSGQTGAEPMSDSVGVGAYRIDLHPSTGGRNFVDIGAYPFQLPLGAFIPVRMRNLLPACKNLGVTHVANGCTRLHPVEWNIGETAGALAAFCIRGRVEPSLVRANPVKLAEFQRLLMDLGVELEWPEDARHVAL